MPQETTEQFGHRLRVAVEGHPLAPPTPHGRQRWLINKLRTEAGTQVSPNTMHKWMNGMARPREDKVRDLSRVLSVDELWLAFGRNPASAAEKAMEAPSRADAAVLIAAGLAESSGFRVTFAGPDSQAHLHVNTDRGSFDLVAVAPQWDRNKCSFIIPEPVGSSRVVGVVVAGPDPGDGRHSACIDLLDLTDLTRQNFGGFSILSLERRRDGRFKAEGRRNLINPLPGLLDLCPSDSEPNASKTG
jgi:hypothetical protein